MTDGERERGGEKEGVRMVQREIYTENRRVRRERGAEIKGNGRDMRREGEWEGERDTEY